MIKQTSNLLSQWLNVYNEMDEDKKKEFDPIDVWNTALNIFNNGNSIIGTVATELEMGLDVSSNKIYLTGEIREHDGIFFHQKLDIIRKLNPEGDEEPVKLIIDSCGGDIYSMFTIVDSIQLSKLKVNTIGFGSIMSAASLILACGTGIRYLAPNASIMIHEMSSTLEGNSSNIKSNTNHIEELEERWLELYSQFTGKSKNWWRTKMAKDFFIDAKTAIKYGLADEILTKEIWNA